MSVEKIIKQLNNNETPWLENKSKPQSIKKENESKQQKAVKNGY